MSDKIELFYAPTSPYVRKLIACAIELGIADRIVRLPTAAHPLKRDERIAAAPIIRLTTSSLRASSRASWSKACASSPSRNMASIS